MRSELKQAVDLFVENKEAVQKAFAWETGHMHPLCGLMFSSNGKKADVNRMKEAEAYLKNATGLFSEFRGNVKMALVTHMAMEDNMEKYFSNVQKVYNSLKKSVWLSSEFHIIAAMIIAQKSDGDDAAAAQYVSEMNEIYDKMKKNHPWLTSNEDMGLAALLAVSELDIDLIINEMETCYQEIKASKTFSSANGIQSLSHVLALSFDGSIDKCNRVIAIYNGLKQNKKNYGHYFELSTLGGLALTDVSVSVLVQDITDIDDYLKTQKGFGALGIGGTQRLMYAAMLVLQHYAPKDMNMDATALGGIVSMIIAEQVAMMAALTAAVAVTSSTN